MQDRRSLWANAVLTLLLLAAIFACLNTLSRDSYARIDLTRDKEFTLSPAARTILRGLEDELRIEVFLSENLPPQFALHTQRIKDKLAEMTAVSPVPIRVTYIDPGESDEATARAQRLGVSPRETSIRSRGKMEAQVTWLGLSIHYRDRSEVLPFIDSTAFLEYEIGRAIRSLQTEAGRAVIGCVTGHGEPDFAAAATEQGNQLAPLANVLQENYDLVSVDLTADVPENIDVLLLMGPQQQLSEAELFRLDSYVMKGGALGVFPLVSLPDPQTLQLRPAPVDLSPLWATWGIEVDKSLVIDRHLNGLIPLPATIRTARGAMRINRRVSSPLVPIANNLDREHPITRRLDTIVAPFASSIDAQAAVSDVAIDATVLVATSDRSTAGAVVTSLDPRLTPAPSDKEIAGPHAVFVSLKGSFASAWAGRVPEDIGDSSTGIEVPERSPDGTRLVIGTSFEMPIANPQLLLAMVDWMAADETLLGIRPSMSAPPVLELPEGGGLELIKQANVVGMPLLVVLFGVLRLRRRKRRG
ncbi:MAG TPA: hypothetical protein DIU15_12480 [Deltaproteobacteria bacterium]|nr:hypothetical protein [Deltaproteobacteria bacterium]HCP46854.1 hypothetical protein [Deltaproteobacteria bacterium]